MNKTPENFRARGWLLASLSAASLLSVACSAHRPGPTVGVAAVCEPILEKGLLTTEILADPQISGVVNRLLCESLVTVARSPSWFGFPEGTAVMGGRVRRDEFVRSFVTFRDDGGYDSWYREHCGSDPHGAWRQQWKAWNHEQEERRALCVVDGDIQGFWARIRRQELAAWRPALDLLPRDEVAAWRQCSLLGGMRHTGTRRLACRGFAAPREDGVVVFEVRSHPSPPVIIPLVQLVMGPRLKEDLLVEGAQCEGLPWLEGKQFRELRRAPHVLECRREGAKAVRIELRTRHETCTFLAPPVETSAEERAAVDPTAVTTALSSRPIADSVPPTAIARLRRGSAERRR